MPKPKDSVKSRIRKQRQAKEQERFAMLNDRTKENKKSFRA